ncbi:MAG: fibronectin type III domain-containing protein, partial [Gaiellales bacterium]
AIGAVASPGTVLAIATSIDGSSVYAATATRVDAMRPDGTARNAITGTAITSIAVCPAVVPRAPTGVTADEGDTIVDVTWNAPADTGGAAITGFTATATPGGATCTTTGATTCLFTGLRNGTAYTFKVAATNVAGTGAASAASNRVTPHKDTRPRALALGPRKVRFSKKGVGVSFAVTVDGPGVIAAAMSFKRDRACQVSRRVWTAGTYQVTCVMAMAGRTAARRRARTYTLVATFSPTNGSLASALTTVVVPRRR